MTLAWAPAATIAGAVSLRSIGNHRRASGRSAAAAARRASRTTAFSYGAIKNLPGFWTVGLTASGERRSRLCDGVAAREGAPFELQEIGSDQSIGDALRALIEPHLTKPKSVSGHRHLGPCRSRCWESEHPSNLMAIVISGDGGWRDLDKTIAERSSAPGRAGRRMGQPALLLEQENAARKPPTTSPRDANLHGQMARERSRADRLFLWRRRDAVRIQPACRRLCVRTWCSSRCSGFPKTADFEITVSGWLGEPPGPNALPVCRRPTKSRRR